MIASIVIPTLNEENYIERCLKSVLTSDFPPEEMEVIIADAFSSDRTREIITRIAAEDSRVQLVDNPKRIAPSGVNIGILASRGEYIIRMDAHAEYPRDYVRNCIEELKRTGADNVGGCCDTLPGSNTAMAHAIAMALQHPFGVGGSAFRLGLSDRYVDTVPFGAFRRSVLERVGLFNENMARHEDFELNTRIRQSGGKIYLSSKICNTYYSRPSLKSLIHQTFQNGRWNARAWVWYPETFAPRRAAPPVFVLTLMLSLAMAPFSKIAFATAALTLGAYVCACLYATIDLARRARKGAALLPIVFFTMHVTFGVACLIGLFGAAASRPGLEPPSLASVAHG